MTEKKHQHLRGAEREARNAAIVKDFLELKGARSKAYKVLVEKYGLHYSYIRMIIKESLDESKSRKPKPDSTPELEKFFSRFDAAFRVHQRMLEKALKQSGKGRQLTNEDIQKGFRPSFRKLTDLIILTRTHMFDITQQSMLQSKILQQLYLTLDPRIMRPSTREALKEMFGSLEEVEERLAKKVWGKHGDST